MPPVFQTSAVSYYYTTDAVDSTILLTDPTDSVAAQYSPGTGAVAYSYDGQGNQTVDEYSTNSTY